jgi:hypothetical protein
MPYRSVRAAAGSSRSTSARTEARRASWALSAAAAPSSVVRSVRTASLTRTRAVGAASTVHSAPYLSYKPAAGAQCQDRTPTNQLVCAHTVVPAVLHAPAHRRSAGLGWPLPPPTRSSAAPASSLADSPRASPPHLPAERPLHQPAPSRRQCQSHAPRLHDAQDGVPCATRAAGGPAAVPARA